MYVHIFREKTHAKTSLFPGCEGTFSAGVGRGKRSVTRLQSLQTVINHVFPLCVAMCFYVSLSNQAKGNKAHFRLTAK